MRGGFRSLVHPGTRVSEVDLEATRSEREDLHRRLRLRAHLVDLFASIPPDDDRLVVDLDGE